MVTETTTETPVTRTSGEAELIRQWIQDQIESITEPVKISSDLYIGYTIRPLQGRIVINNLIVNKLS